MTIASLIEVRLADGSEPPAGAAARLLVDFDPFWSMHGLRGRRRLLGVLSEEIGRVASDAELDAVLSSLLGRGFIESQGEYVGEYMGPFGVGPNISEGARIRISQPDEPEVGEWCYRPTFAGLRAARLCAELRAPMGRCPWVLGSDRVDDQVVLAAGGGSGTALEFSLRCSNTPEQQIGDAVARLVAGDVLEPDGDRDGTPLYRPTLAGEVRCRELKKEVGSVVARLVLPPAGWEQAVPAALRIQPERKLELLGNLTEDQLCRRVIMPLLTAIGFLDVTYNGGPQERGKDIYCWRADELGAHQWLAVLAKAGDVTGAAAGNSSTLAIAAQMRQVFFDPVVAAPAGRGVHMDRCWVILSGRLLGDALSKVENELRGMPLMRSTRWIDGSRLVRLLDMHYSQVWSALLEDRTVND